MNEIGIIGSKESILMIDNIEMNIEVNLIFLAYNHPKEAQNIIHDYKEDIDAFIFLGPIPYSYCSELLERERLLYKVIEYDHYVLSTTLFNFNKTRSLYHSKFSIDTFNEDVVMNVLDDLKINSKNIYMMENSEQYSIDTLKKFHTLLWEKGEIDFVLTGISSVVRELESRDIPCYKVDFSSHSYLQAVEELNLVIKYKKLKLKTLVVGSLIVHNRDELRPEMYYENEKKILEIYKALLDICSKYDLSIYRLNNAFKIIGTKGSFSNVMKMEELIILINKYGLQAERDISIGFGSGETSVEADSNSLKALELFEMNNKTIYLVTNNEGIEVVSNEQKKNYSYLFKKVEDKYSINEKKLFIDYLNISRTKNLNVREYVKYSQVSYRTGTRLFNKLLTDSIIYETGIIESKVGRPAISYSIKEEE